MRMVKSQKWLSMLLLPLLLLACSRAPEAKPITPSVSPDMAALQVRTLEALWTKINDSYVYDDFHGLDWGSVLETYEPQAATAEGEAFDDLLREVVAPLPEQSVAFQTRQERIEQAVTATDTSTYEGIGAFVSVLAEPEPRVTILSIMPGSPAEAAGIKAHDSILAVDGEPVRAEEGDDVIMRVRGPAATDVVLQIRTPLAGTRDVTVTRGRVERSQLVTPVKVEVLPGTKVGYVAFPPSTYEAIMQDLVTGLQLAFNEGNMTSLILDLRAVHASDTDWPLGAMLTLFANGDLGQFYSRTEQNPLTVEGQNVFGSQVIPLTVLVGENTTGFAEVFAAALQDSGRATVVGAQTPGSVEIMESFFLPNGSQLFLTTTTYRTANGRDIGLLGVEPDVVVAATWDSVSAEVDVVRETAVNLASDNGG